MKGRPTLKSYPRNVRLNFQGKVTSQNQCKEEGPRVQVSPGGSLLKEPLEHEPSRKDECGAEDRGLRNWIKAEKWQNEDKMKV